MTDRLPSRCSGAGPDDDQTIVANPDRGFYRYSETHLGRPDRPPEPLDAGQLRDQRHADGTTLVFRYVYLDGHQSSDVLPDEDLDRVADDVEQAEAGGVGLILRFAYAEDSELDATPDRVVGHIRQLAPVLNAGGPSVFAVQAGFVGRWGEWYYSRYFSGGANRGWVVSRKDWRNRARVLHALLDELDDEIPVQVRYPEVARRLLRAEDVEARRVGIHNDGFLGSDSDLGTYRRPPDRAWLLARSPDVLIGGETCVPHLPRSSWAEAREEMERFHWTFLNRDFHPEVLAGWGTEGLDECRRRLGYRLRLVHSRLPDQATPGTEITAALTIVNEGWSAPVRRRSVVLVAVDGERVVTTTVAADVRSWRPGVDVEVEARFAAPPTGTYEWYLVLPGPGRSVEAIAPRGSRSGASAIRLLGTGGWDDTSGWNRLPGTLVVV